MAEGRQGVTQVPLSPHPPFCTCKLCGAEGAGGGGGGSVHFMWTTIFDSGVWDFTNLRLCWRDDRQLLRQMLLLARPPLRLYIGTRSDGSGVVKKNGVIFMSSRGALNAYRLLNPPEPQVDLRSSKVTYFFIPRSI